MWGKRIKNGVFFVVVLGAVGFLTDAFFGLPLILGMGSTSWAAWLLSILGLGALYLAGEGVAEWIHRRDTVGDRLWRRALHLALLLAVVVVFLVASAMLLSSTK